MNVPNIIATTTTDKKIRYSLKCFAFSYNAYHIIGIITFLCSFICSKAHSLYNKKKTKIQQHSHRKITFREKNEAYKFLFGLQSSMHIVWDWYNKSFLINQYSEIWCAQYMAPCVYYSPNAHAYHRIHIYTQMTSRAHTHLSHMQPYLRERTQ